MPATPVPPDAWVLGAHAAPADLRRASAAPRHIITVDAAALLPAGADTSPTTQGATVSRLPHRGGAYGPVGLPVVYARTPPATIGEEA